MKELASRVPIVYMCVRGENDGGFPKATPGILKWFKDGAIGELGVDVTAPDIASDSDYIIATLRHSLFLLNLLKHLSDLIEDVFQTTPTRYRSLDGHIKVSKSSFEWMWDFFADYKQPYVTARGLFWETVKAQTHVDFVRLRNSGSTATSEWAKSYLSGSYGGHIEQAVLLLRQSLTKWYSKGLGRQRCDSLTVIICFDEASRLCTTSSVTGNRINTGDEESAADPELANGYSNFRAMGRALRYLRIHDNPVPRVFGLFTDTSRLTNFQPRKGDERSRRVVDLPYPGSVQFDPIYVFTSIDAHAMAEDRYYAKSDPTEVARAETLLKFGRAGWYSCYSRDSQSFSMQPLLRLAKSKLVGGASDPITVLRDEKEADKNRIRLLAVLACRLALTVGPFSAEARDLVSSHLAILLNTDPDRHFLKIHYPSEPILAEASAGITAVIGWAPALQALYHYLQNGIVNMGYRGELLSKVLCLMAMDRIRKPFSLTSNPTYWRHTQPVKVRDFLDGWLAPPDDYPTFTAALLKSNHRTNATELERFLDGYVFFTHFIRLDRILSVPAMVHAWNRGAAIMCKECTHSFDHVIPVMLAPEKGARTFGDLYGEWNTEELKRACSNVSGIFINSKNYTAAVNHKHAAYGCTPNKQNFEDFEMFGGENVEVAWNDGTPTSVFLSIVQGFGPRRQTEPYVDIVDRGTTKARLPRTYRQLVLVLKELGPNTYKCLQTPDSADYDMMDVVEDEDGSESSDHSLSLPDDADEQLEGVAAELEDSDVELRDIVDYGQLPDFNDEPDDEDYEDSDEDELPDYGPVLPDDGDEDLQDNDFGRATTYLRMLRTANLGYLDDVKKENLSGIKDFLPAIYVGERGEQVKEAQSEWNAGKKKYKSLTAGQG